MRCFFRPYYSQIAPRCDPAVALYLGSYGDPREGGLFLMSEVSLYESSSHDLHLEPFVCPILIGAISQCRLFAAPYPTWTQYWLRIKGIPGDAGAGDIPVARIEAA